MTRLRRLPRWLPARLFAGRLTGRSGLGCRQIEQLSPTCPAPEKASTYWIVMVWVVEGLNGSGNSSNGDGVVFPASGADEIGLGADASATGTKQDGNHDQQARCSGATANLPADAVQAELNQSDPAIPSMNQLAVMGSFYPLDRGR